MDLEQIIDQVPVEAKDLPEEARQALDMLRAGKTPDDTFCLQSELTLAQKQRKVLVAKVVTGLWLMLALGLCVMLMTFGTLFAVSVWVVTQTFLLLLMWFLWVQEAQALVDDPWYESMICTPNFLLVLGMGGTIRLIKLAEWQGGAMLTRSGKYIVHYLHLIGASRKLDLGSIGGVGEQKFKDFADQVHRRILALSVK